MNLFKYKYLFAKILSNIITKRNEMDSRVLMYHSVYEDKLDRIDHFSVSKDNFYKQMKFLKDNSMKLVHFGEEKPGEKCVAITFDDGFQDNLLTVAPIMEDLNIPWTIFIVTDFLDNSYQNFLNIDGLKTLSQFKMVRIGAHGKTHRPLKSLSFEDAKKELSSSKNTLESILNIEINSMSYPHGSRSLELSEAAKNIGFDNIGNSLPLPKEDNLPNEINRIAIYDYDSVSDLRNKLFGKWDWLGKRLLKNEDR